MAKSLSFIHTADLHLGRKFQDLGRQGRTLRKRILEAFSRTVDAALDRSVDLVLIAGDLFDSPEPAGEALVHLQRGFDRLAVAGIRVCAMPGTHDPSHSQVYSSALFSARPDRLVLLRPEQNSVVFEDLDLAVGAWFPSRSRKEEWISPPEGWHCERTFRIAMAHGSAMPRIGEEGPTDLIPRELLDDPGLGYCALGHHHGTGPVEGARAPAYYSGAPEMLAVDQKEAGNVLHVILRETGAGVKATVERVRVGSLRYRRIEFLAGEAGERDIESEIEAMADLDLFLDVEIKGVAPLDAALPDWVDLQDRLGPGFFKLRVIDRSLAGDAVGSLEDLPTNSVTAEFVRRIRGRIESARESEKGEWEEALRLGLHFLMGSDRR